jgi:hypothetical protein
MDRQETYTNTDFFARELQEVFVPRKAHGTNLLFLDGRASYCSSSELLQFAKENDVTVLHLPNDCTATLQL